jgi:hypothetical protein
MWVSIKVDTKSLAMQGEFAAFCPGKLYAPCRGGLQAAFSGRLKPSPTWFLPLAAACAGNADVSDFYLFLVAAACAGNAGVSGFFLSLDIGHLYTPCRGGL